LTQNLLITFQHNQNQRSNSIFQTENIKVRRFQESKNCHVFIADEIVSKEQNDCFFFNNEKKLGVNITFIKKFWV